MPGEALADPHHLLEDLGRLQRSHRAGKRTEDAALGAARDHARRRRRRVQAAIAGQTPAETRLEGRELPLEAEQGGGDQDLAGGVAGVVEGEPGLEIVAAVRDRVIAGDEAGDIARVQPRGMRDQPDFGIDRGDRLGRACHLRHADPVGRVDHLALQVGEVHRIVVHHADRAHPRRGEIEQQRRAQTAGADHQDAGLQQLLLADAADFGQDDVPRIALELLFGHRHRTGPGEFSRRFRSSRIRRCCGRFRAAPRPRPRQSGSPGLSPSGRCACRAPPQRARRRNWREPP